jgi:hypothetical protein
MPGYDTLLEFVNSLVPFYEKRRTPTQKTSTLRWASGRRRRVLVNHNGPKSAIGIPHRYQSEPQRYSFHNSVVLDYGEYSLSLKSTYEPKEVRSVMLLTHSEDRKFKELLPPLDVVHESVRNKSDEVRRVDLQIQELELKLDVRKYVKLLETKKTLDGDINLASQNSEIIAAILGVKERI